VDTRFFTAQREAGGLCLQVLARAHELREVLASAAAAFFSAGFVDLVGALCGIGKDQHLIPRDLQKPAADGHRLFGAASLDPHDARHERGEQRRMPRQNAHDPLGSTTMSTASSASTSRSAVTI
jgi:hypothetical protein